ncbi:MAG TPA: NifU family protein [Thermodesulfovibrio thiophilus]|uniref:NifU family protein n=1 Tax=Thermodesulfovibrio thiophilus TaxID=340095 RepID=UPI0003FC7CAF|nr:NifU family protein [Thermodesulfovibrio thiophilus]HHW20429.1 NifU family protein [Thermodesulfovibrio thiophilus]HOA83566.1 NifU family protein [Thermodesulfovibrio thiophilus]HQA04263.1 NifU family protein [Thermodesulfovibrio thiophilus]HQD36756.1 NifU family protein [Thermodesulfovibrio thiophilus]
MIDRAKVEQILGKIRVGLMADGGNIDLVDIKEDVIYVKLKGACGTCPMATLTLKNWVEKNLKTEIPEVKEVVAV